jgi:L-lactate dehydrogenase complex protein LldG
MSAAREAILAAIRQSLGPRAAGAAATVQARLSHPPTGPVPARARSSGPGARAAFVAMAREASASLVEAREPGEVPGLVARYLAQNNLGAELAAAPDPALAAIPWSAAPMLRLKRGAPGANDAVGISLAYAGVAETGTCVQISGPEWPTSIAFLPDTHIVVLPAARLVGGYEEVWRLLRAECAPAWPARMPRSVNFITGPSRTADIEQTMQLGAHGPRRLHIVLLGEGP